MNRVTQRPAAVGGAVLVILLALGLAAAQVAAGTNNPGRGMTLDLYSRLTDLNGTAMPSQPGDEGLVGRDLYALGGDAASPVPVGDPIGRLVGVCTLVTSTEGICHGVFTIDGQGTLTAYLKLEVGSPGNVEAITGGTGDFTGASGTIAETPVAGNPTDHIFHIELSGFNRP